VEERSARSRPRISALVAVAAIAAGIIAEINVFQTFGPIHLHNDGPLGSLSGASFAFASDTTGPWTAGYELCLQAGADPVMIESVSPASLVGDGLTYLGAFVREIPGLTDTSTRTGAIGNIAGFPPTVSETLRPVAGTPVTHPCTGNGPLSPYTELDVGVGKPAHSTGGGWTGFTVDYRVGLTQYIATWDTGLYACGPSQPADQCFAPV
jgi:hypothetical protein